MLKYFLFICTIICLILGCSQKQNKNEFTLEGKFEGKDTQFLILKYYDLKNVLVTDTINIINEKFKAKGYINDGTKVVLVDDKDVSSSGDPNLTWFFIDTGQNTIYLEENNFKDIRVEGSISENDSKKLEASKTPIFKEMDSLKKENKRLTLLKKSTKDIKKRNALNKLIKNNNTEWSKNQNKIKKIRLDYVYNNPGSYVSPYPLNIVKRKIPLDSLVFYYNILDKNVQRSHMGKEIKSYISKERGLEKKSKVKAPNFVYLDNNNNEISLEKFKGKYVLLDFWANWCGPCLKKHPDLKRIYKIYNAEGFDILGVSFDKDIDTWKESIKKQNINVWNHIFIGKDNVKNQGSIAIKYNIQPIPAYILIDKEGYIIGRYLNADSKNKSFQDLEEKLKEIFE